MQKETLDEFFATFVLFGSLFPMVIVGLLQ